jgi:hypothetical protein
MKNLLYNSIAIIIIFLISYYVFAVHNNIEGMKGNTDTKNCPNMLVQIGSNYYLYNSKRAKVPGVNPLRFNNLEEYTEFVSWQKSQGITCPVLYVQKMYDAQGEPVYKMRSDPSALEAGLPSSIETIPVDAQEPLVSLLRDSNRNDQPYNDGSYPGFDSHNLYVGTTTPLDLIYSEGENTLVSSNPMDPNWGGPEYSRRVASVQRGNDPKQSGTNFNPKYIYENE